MELIRSSFKVLGNPDGDKILESIEAAGRTCYKSESLISSNSSREFASKILKRGHESVIEHEKLSVRIICDRGVTHEIVRHRLASYSQESTRYVDYNNPNITFIIPCWCGDLVEGIYHGVPDIPAAGQYWWVKSMLEAEHAYKTLRSYGWKPEEARSVLPNSLKTEIVMTANLREWRLFFRLRTDKSAHPQMREISRPMLQEFKSIIPIIFDDIEVIT